MPTPAEHDDEPQRGVHDVVGRHHADGGEDHHRGDDPERDVGRDGERRAVGGAERADHEAAFFAAPSSTFASEPDSYASNSGTVSNHCPRRSLSWSRSWILNLGVLVLGAPEQRLERADLDADAAVHAERVVDVEAVERVDLTGLAAGTARRGERLVRLDVDAPVRALAGAQHARRCSCPPASEMTPRARVAASPSRAGTGRWRRPWTATAAGAARRGTSSPSLSGSVTPRPLRTPGILGLGAGIRTPP